MGLAVVVVDVYDYPALAFNRQPLAYPPKALRRAREDEFVKQPLVVAHAARSMVVDTDSE
jgi:hypothetical protein